MRRPKRLWHTSRTRNTPAASAARSRHSTSCTIATPSSIRASTRISSVCRSSSARRIGSSCSERVRQGSPVSASFLQNTHRCRPLPTSACCRCVALAAEKMHRPCVRELHRPCVRERRRLSLCRFPRSNVWQPTLLRWHRLGSACGSEQAELLWARRLFLCKCGSGALR